MVTLKAITCPCKKRDEETFTDLIAAFDFSASQNYSSKDPNDAITLDSFMKQFALRFGQSEHKKNNLEQLEKQVQKSGETLEELSPKIKGSLTCVVLLRYWSRKPSEST